MFDQNFLKYQSLGNDFILFDFLNQNKMDVLHILKQNSWNEFVQKNCNRHFGIGADGILVLLESETKDLPEVFIFNADGSRAEICLNGLRCVAHYLYKHYKYPNEFFVKMGGKLIECQIKKLEDEIEIVTKVPAPNYLCKKKINVLGQEFEGHVVDVGNPHFIIFQKTSIDWLTQNGHLIESHQEFVNKTNVEFVWQEDDLFNVLVYERGCGITLACSSGATAIAFLLKYLKMISNKEVILKMPGGKVSCFIQDDFNILLQAKASLVFQGLTTKF